ncbi:MAG: DNA polymerase III subunit gamma and tau [Actinomycetota bacterium]|nr:DNA polymerase III subunit gamma and tau [Actinomycetota bacterium]
MALALYRKYRPATFAEVVGQEHVTEPLRTALAAGRINHAYLFSGPRGCGKTSSARILARSLNCVHGPTPDPCGECPSCIALAPEGPGSLDVVELDAASHGGVDDTRELRDRAFYMPAESRYRVFIIDEAHMVSTQGFNALLKIVEEPPEHLVFIFATTEPDKVLTTIRSRTHHYPFRLIPPATLRALLEKLCAEEGAAVDPAVYPLVIRAGGGSARDSLSVLDQLLAGAGPDGVSYASAVALLGVTDSALLDEVVDALAAADGASVFGAVDKVVEAGHDPRRFAADLLQRLRDLMVLGAVPDAAEKGLIDVPDDELVSMTAQADRLGAATVSRMAEVVHTGLVDMRGTTAPRLVLELMCARMLLPAASTADGALLQRLERMERRMSIAGEPAAANVPSSTPAPAPVLASPPVPTAAAPGPAAARADVAPAPASVGAAAPAPPAPASGTASGGEKQFARRSQPANAAPTATAPTSVEPPVPALAPDTVTKPPARSTLGLPPPPSLQSDAVPRQQAAPSPPTQTPAEKSPAGNQEDEQPPAEQPSAGQSPAEQPPPEPTAAAESASENPVPPQVPPRAGKKQGDVEVTDVRRVWSEVLAAVQRRRRTTQILLESATVAEVSGGVLRLTMPHAGMARRVVEPANADLLREALREVLGVDWTISCDAGDAAPDGQGRPDSMPRLPAREGASPGTESAARSAAGGARQNRPAGTDRTPDPVPPPDEEIDEIPDDYGDPDIAASSAPHDPEQAAVDLLAAELGGRRLDPSG